jgi:hypothetical protein
MAVASKVTLAVTVTLAGATAMWAQSTPAPQADDETTSDSASTAGRLQKVVDKAQAVADKVQDSKPAHEATKVVGPAVHTWRHDFGGVHFSFQPLVEEVDMADRGLLRANERTVLGKTRVAVDEHLGQWTAEQSAMGEYVVQRNVGVGHEDAADPRNPLDRNYQGPRVMLEQNLTRPLGVQSTAGEALTVRQQFKTNWGLRLRTREGVVVPSDGASQPFGSFLVEAMKKIPFQLFGKQHSVDFGVGPQVSANRQESHHMGVGVDFNLHW